MTDDDNGLQHIEVDHTKLDISSYKEGDQPPVIPTFVMTLDNLSGQAARWWLEWPEHLPVGATSFGALVRAAREALHLPPSEVARQIMKADRQALSVGYLKAIELGNRCPSPELIPQFARVLHLPEDVLYYSLGRLPADLSALPATAPQIQAAFHAMQTLLHSD